MPTWNLLSAVLRQEPDHRREARAADAETLIGGFMKLIGQEEVWENIKKGNAVPRAWAWFQGALKGALGFVRRSPAGFIAALQVAEIFDIVAGRARS